MLSFSQFLYIGSFVFLSFFILYLYLFYTILLNMLNCKLNVIFSKPYTKLINKQGTYPETWEFILYKTIWKLHIIILYYIVIIILYGPKPTLVSRIACVQRVCRRAGAGVYDTHSIKSLDNRYIHLFSPETWKSAAFYLVVYTRTRGTFVELINPYAACVNLHRYVI